MGIKQAFYDYCISNTDIQAEIDDRLFFKEANQTAELHVSVYTMISNPTFHDINIAYPRIQIDHYGHTPVEDVADAFKKALRRFKGVMGGYPVKQIVLIDESDEPSGDDDIYRISQDYKIIYKE